MKANTLDDIAATCGASRGEVLAQISTELGDCDKSDVDFDKPIKNIASECGASSGSGSSSSIGNGGKSSGSGDGDGEDGEEEGDEDSDLSSSSSRVYKTTQIGNQVWMAENLNEEVDGSKCYNNVTKCEGYGRLYTREAAISACPDGWHLPSNDEWQELKDYVQSENKCSDCAGKYLKDRSSWDLLYDYGINGLDTYGFSASPGGKISVVSGSTDLGRISYWWSATKYSGDYPCEWYIYGNSEFLGLDCSNEGIQLSMLSVRCVQD